jgi:DnaJ-class molecular chaperone
VSCDEDDDTCRTCRGTGIGQYGDPNTSRCYACGGSGVKKPSRDDVDDGDAAYEERRDRQLEEA